MKYTLTKDTKENRERRNAQFKAIESLSDNELNEAFHKGDKQAFSKIDCLACANCCKTHSPILEQEDLEQIAHSKEKSMRYILTEWVEMDEEGDFVFQSQPCPMLNSDNSCSIYESRPNACREYPHTTNPNMRQILDITLENSFICPAVDHIARNWEDISADLK